MAITAQFIPKRKKRMYWKVCYELMANKSHLHLFPWRLDAKALIQRAFWLKCGIVLPKIYTVSRCQNSLSVLFNLNNLHHYHWLQLFSFSLGSSSFGLDFPCIDDEFGEKTVSVLLDGEESEIVFIDHPSSEMSVSFYSFFLFIDFPVFRCYNNRCHG